MPERAGMKSGSPQKFIYIPSYEKWNTWFYTIKHTKSFYYINPNKMHMLQSFMVSDICSICFGHYYHPSSRAQKTVTTVSGNHYTVQLSSAIVKHLELIWVCCGWCTPPTTHSNQFQLFHDSSRQLHSVTVTRYCSYSFLCLWRWVIVMPETCRAAVRYHKTL
jgi:hypothetical protein